MKDTSKITLFTALLLAPLATMHAADAPKPASTPNIIVILADDLGWADLSCYGSKFHESPNLDRLAAEGMRFTQAYSSSPYCSPSRAAILTGRHPARLKITDYIPSNGKSGKSGKLLPAEMKMELPLEEVTIAEILKDAGYATWHVGKWHLGREPFLPQNQAQKAKAYHGSPVPGLKEGGQQGEHLCDRLTSEATKLVERRKTGQPFFLYLAFYDVHTPIMAQPELVKKYEAKAARLGLPSVQKAPRYTEDNRAHGGIEAKMPETQVNPTYAAMIETMDTNVGRLMAKLEELGISDKTLIIFTSDNGGHSVTSNRPLPPAARRQRLALRRRRARAVDRQMARRDQARQHLQCAGDEHRHPAHRVGGLRPGAKARTAPRRRQFRLAPLWRH